MLKRMRQLSLTHFFLIFLLLAASFLRFYNLENSLSFQGDQGRDAILVAKIFKEKDLVFIGPVTSVGNMYLGPLYYYFMLPWLWLSYPSPMGPAYAVAALGILTVWLIYQFGRELIGKRAALIATFFFTFTSTVITYTRFSWNPNPAPFVSVVMIYFTYLAWKKNPWYWTGVIASFAVIIQLHYLALLSGAGAGVIWLISLYQNWQDKNKTKKIKQQLQTTLVGIGILLLSFLPLILFDAKHGWLNAKAFTKLLTLEGNFKVTTNFNLGEKIMATLKETHGQSMHILFEIAIGQQRLVNTLLLILTIFILGWLLLKGKKNKHSAGWIVIAAYLLTGILGTSLYEHTIFDHYIAYLFPVTAWVYGIVIDFLLKKGKFIGKILSLSFAVYFLWFNAQRWPLQDLGWKLSDIKHVSQVIYNHLQPGEKYGLVLFSESGDLDGQNYRYFLSTTDHPPLARAQTAKADTLIIINEDHSLKDIAASPVYEIVTFPQKQANVTLTIPDGPEIVILRRN